MEKIHRFKLFVSDIDGTLTDGLMTFDAHGNVSKSYQVNDCSGLYRLQRAGIHVLLLTGSKHSCDYHRFKFLIPEVPAATSPGRLSVEAEDYLTQGVSYDNKAIALDSFIQKHKIRWDEVAYIGDAENDIPPMKMVGYSCCPRSAVMEVKQIAHMVSHFDGGRGAVAEFADVIMKHGAFADKTH